jgi:hypothetical protein
MKPSKLRTLDSNDTLPTPKIAEWYRPIQTPDGPARLWRLIPAEAFTQCVIFDSCGIDRRTLGDVPPLTEGQRAEFCKFIGRAVYYFDRDVNRYQGTPGWQHVLTTWPESELLRVAKAAAEFAGLR